MPCQPWNRPGVGGYEGWPEIENCTGQIKENGCVHFGRSVTIATSIPQKDISFMEILKVSFFTILGKLLYLPLWALLAINYYEIMHSLAHSTAANNWLQLSGLKG